MRIPLSRALAFSLLAPLVTLVPGAAFAAGLGISGTTSESASLELGNQINALASITAASEDPHAASASATALAGLSVTADAAAAPLTLTRASLEATGTEAMGASSATGTDAALYAHAKATLAAHAHLTKVELSPTQVAFTYDAPAKLFGLIGVRVPLSISVTSAGSTTVAYPWYGFLLAGNTAGLSILADAAVTNDLASTTAGAAFSPALQATLLDSLSTLVDTQESAQVSE